MQDFTEDEVALMFPRLYIVPDNTRVAKPVTPLNVPDMPQNQALISVPNLVVLFNGNKEHLLDRSSNFRKITTALDIDYLCNVVCLAHELPNFDIPKIKAIWLIDASQEEILTIKAAGISHVHHSPNPNSLITKEDKLKMFSGIKAFASFFERV